MNQKAGSFEQPMDEIVRLLLRLEALFDTYKRHTRKLTEFSSGAALSTLVRLLNVTDRSDLKNKLIAQVMQQVTGLMALKESPHVDQNKLDTLIGIIEADLVLLRGVKQGFGTELRHNQLLNTVRAQLALPGGLLAVDTPQFALWLQQPGPERQASLDAWMSEFELLERVSLRLLSLLRDSSECVSCEAVRGHYEKTLDSSQPCHLVRVELNNMPGVYPTISVGMHRVVISFYRVDALSQGGSQRYYENVPFKMYLGRL